MDRAGRRRANLAKLKKLGFRPSPTLPLIRTAGGRGRLRPAREIAMRLCALDALFTWVVFGEKGAPAKRVRSYVERSDFASALTPTELAMWNKPRSALRGRRNTVGWYLENVWALAWTLGFEPAPPVSGEMVPRAVSEAIVRSLLPTLDEGIAQLMRKARPRKKAELEAFEDLFYCAHNAARSAQLGGKTVPAGFDVRMGGGVIQERRHALTWALSRGVAWDDTELST